MKSISFGGTAAVFVAVLILLPLLPTSVAAADITVYKSPYCGCCAEWVTHMRSHGHDMKTVEMEDLTAIKKMTGVGEHLQSCHTAVVDGYVIEGHVPSADIRRLLRERPPVLGLTAPGMPQMSPGMHSEIPRDYDVLTFDKEGRLNLFSRY